MLRQLENDDACKVLVKQKQFEIANNKVISKYFFKPMFPMFYSLTFGFMIQLILILLPIKWMVIPLTKEGAGQMNIAKHLTIFSASQKAIVDDLC